MDEERKEKRKGEKEKFPIKINSKNQTPRRSHDLPPGI
jgi:hypothetical protein